MKEVNDPPTAVNDDNTQTDGIIVGEVGADRPGVGVNQFIDVLANDSVAPDSPLATATSLGTESLTVVGVGTSASGPFSTSVTTAAGGTAKVVNGQLLYDSPGTIPADPHDTIFYQVSDNSDASRGGPLNAVASARLHIVDFIPKTVGGTVFVDSGVTVNGQLLGAGDGVQEAGEQSLSNVAITITGTSFTGKPINITATTDATGHYSLKDGALGFAPPDANGYKITEQALIGLIDGPAIEKPDSALAVVVGRSFVLNWGITDNSGDIAGLSFTESGFDTRSVANGGTLSDPSGLLQEYLASSGKNGFVFELMPTEP